MAAFSATIDLSITHTFRICLLWYSVLFSFDLYDCVYVYSGVAQGMLQVLGLWYDAEHEELQGIRQKALLCCVCTYVTYAA